MRSSGNEDLVHRAFDALNRGGVDGLLPFLDADVEWISIPGFLPDAEDHRGHRGVREWFEMIDDVVAEPRWEVVEMADAGERVLVSLAASGRGKGSGAPVAVTIFQVITVANGKAVRVEGYLQRSDAVKAAGLRG
jgi:ketosteroid isomerase-like protein